jgi:FtsH-binding integral membrane protein
MYAVYAWMAAALTTSAAVAYYVAHTPALFAFIYHNIAVCVGLLILQVAILSILSINIMRMSFTTAVVLFISYAVSMGAGLSFVVYLFTMSSISTTFLTTAGMFGGMAVYGYFTKTDLTSMGNFAIMVLLGLFLSMTVNMWFRNPAFDLMISAIGVLVFCALTASDVQKIKQMAYELITDEETLGKVTLICALQLYLNFINLFLFLLRFLGKRRQD